MVSKEAIIGLAQGLEIISPLPKKHVIASEVAYKGDCNPVVRNIQDCINRNLYQAKSIELLNPFGRWTTMDLSAILEEVAQFVHQTYENSWKLDVGRSVNNCQVTIQRNPLLGVVTITVTFGTSARLGDGTAYYESGEGWKTTQRKGAYTTDVSRTIRVKV